MHRIALLFSAVFLAVIINVPVARAERKTVCTVTVNSADEKEALRRHLPPDRYDFVELVEHGRADWLESACRVGVSCDVLVISGHYDGGNEFFSERTEAREFLPVAELERVSCSESCPKLFSHLKEVYLFGCNTLNAEATQSASAEIARSLTRGGLSRADAERMSRSLNVRHGASSRDRMRQVFRDVPVIYGFSSVAPLGPAAASTLDRYLTRAGTSAIGSGRADPKLLAHFEANGMTTTRGLSDADAGADVRRDVCQFVDERMTAAQRAQFVHQLLQRPMAEVRMFLDRLETYAATPVSNEAISPELGEAQARIATDDPARQRFLDFARDADQPAVRARMIAVAGTLGWLDAAQQVDEQVRMIDELVVRRAVGAAEVDLVCTLNRDHQLDNALVGATSSLGAQDVDVAHAAVLACLGSADHRAQVLNALVSDNPAHVQLAHVYLRHQPIEDVAELRAMTGAIARMPATDSQVRALEALGRHRLSDPESLEVLTRLFPAAASWHVQSAIAGVLIRADYQSLARPELVQTLRKHRLKSPHGDDVIDALIRRLQLH